MDSRLIPGRELTSQESYEMLLRDIKLANKLGFTILRTKLGVKDDILTPVDNWREFIQMALPDAEKYNVRMCPEIHHPTMLKSQMVDDFVDFIQKTGTRHFGLTIDFGTMQTNPLPSNWMANEDSVFSPVSDLEPLLPYSFACHAKFYNMSDEFVETTTPYDKIIELLVRNNWDGYLLSEYEGPHADVPGYTSDQLRKQHVMMRPCWERSKRMLEKEYVQSRGFRNVIADGEKTGFQVAIRSNYYRGIWLSQLRPATVIVDGETYEGSRITWTINGQTFAQSDLANHPDVHWNAQDVATLTIHKPGGLLGAARRGSKVCLQLFYMPPHMDELLSSLTPSKRRMVLVR